MIPGLLIASLSAPAPRPWVITRSTKLKPGTQLRKAGQEAALVIKGSNIVVDFGGLTLLGTPATAEPDARAGIGVRVEGRNVTIKNLKVHGYKVGLLAKNSPGLKITNSDFSYNWKQKLLSTLEKEDLSDWMSFHQNEKGEWLRFGAGIYLDHCDGAVIQGVKIVGGQCGLMMNRTNRASVIGNNFSFLSAIGLGMYRSSENLVQQNKIDWCVRGYSHGVYNRGQDSAGILIYEQSDRNIFAYNSVTHGGDGFFLWAGQTTMDTGLGGCNDNLLIGNDFSHAPTNGIEATFSRNAFANNLLLECWHGAWLGYSYRSLVHRNKFGLNAEAIAWEHGQDNLIHANQFFRDNTGIKLWQKEKEDPTWGYAKKRDTASRGNTIQDNEFIDIPETAIQLTNTKGVLLLGNKLERVKRILSLDAKAEPPILRGNRAFITPSNWEEQRPRLEMETDVANAHTPLPRTMQPSGNLILGLDPTKEAYLARFNVGWQPWGSPDLAREVKDLSPKSPIVSQRLAKVPSPFIPEGQLRGRRYILVDKWGPYDFQSPLLWPRNRKADGEKEVIEFEFLGPKGRWKTQGVSSGASADQSSGSVPGRLTITFPKGSPEKKINLVYQGAQTRDYRGVTTPAGRSVKFGFQEFRLPIAWEVKHFSYDSKTEDPRTNLEAWTRKLNAPGKSAKTFELGGAWYGEPVPGISSDYFGTLAIGKLTAPAGRYKLNVTSDDGVRVWVDGKLVIDNWTYHGPTLDTAELKLGGSHTIEVRHFELNGFSTLKVALEKLGG